MKKPLVVRLAACGNPDFGESPTRMFKDCYEKVSTIAEASQVCRKFIKETIRPSGHSLGSGNWSGGQVYLAESGAYVACIAYNGRAFSESVSFTEIPMDTPSTALEPIANPRLSRGAPRQLPVAARRLLNARDR